METLPAITPQLPAVAPQLSPAPAAARAVGAAEADAAPDAARDADFQALLARSLAGLARGAKGAGGAPGAHHEEDGDAAADTAHDEHPEAALTATDNTLALLAALPQAAVRPEVHPGAASSHGEGAGIERATEPAVPGGKPVRAGERETGLALAADPEKKTERLAHGAEPLPEFKAADAHQNMHAAAQAAHAPALPHGADPAAAGPAAPRIDTPLGAPGWSTALADRMMMFVNAKDQVAELHINPPHLGPVEITLTVSDDKASAVFASPHAVVRETIESALPRLREVLAESGINLGQASVTADSPRDGSAQAQARPSYAGGGDRSAGDSTVIGSPPLAAMRRARSLVDLFA